jgi:hypothetical protein
MWALRGAGKRGKQRAEMARRKRQMAMKGSIEGESLTQRRKAAKECRGNHEFTLMDTNSLTTDQQGWRRIFNRRSKR